MLSAFLRPIRIGPTSAIFIDNIFINVPLNKCIPKIIFEDILDHLLYYNFKIHDIVKKVKSTKLRSKQDEEAKSKFRECLGVEDWSDVIGECESQF